KIVQKVVGVTADGKFGNDTRNAVIKWQKLVGLVADGVVGYNSWKKILSV
ncbi:MAG: peptidoglycan-binding protein, partial [Clostridia bacterium]|nr:peptidoglycan-binding protein [Clostridia bacterium]